MFPLKSSVWGLCMNYGWCEMMMKGIHIVSYAFQLNTVIIMARSMAEHLRLMDPRILYLWSFYRFHRRLFARLDCAGPSQSTWHLWMNRIRFRLPARDRLTSYSFHNYPTLYGITWHNQIMADRESEKNAFIMGLIANQSIWVTRARAGQTSIRANAFLHSS